MSCPTEKQWDEQQWNKIFILMRKHCANQKRARHSGYVDVVPIFDDCKFCDTEPTHL